MGDRKGAMGSRKIWSSVRMLAFVLVGILAFGANVAWCQSDDGDVPAEFVGIWEGSIILDFESWDALLSIVGGSSSSDAPIGTLALDAGSSFCTYYLSMTSGSGDSDGDKSNLLAETRSRLAVSNERACPRGTFNFTKGPSETLLVDTEWQGGEAQMTTLIRIDDSSTGKNCMAEATSSKKSGSKKMAAPAMPDLLGMWEGLIQINFDSWTSVLTLIGGSSDMPIATLMSQSIDHVCVHILEMDPRTENSTATLIRTKHFWIRHLDHDCEPAMFRLDYPEGEKMNVEWLDSITGEGLGFPPKALVHVDDGTTRKACAPKDKKPEKEKKGSGRTSNSG